MVNEDLGLQATMLTWSLAVILLAGWAASLPLLVRLRDGWTTVITNLLGLLWLGFGLGILFRFFILGYDAVTFGDLSNRLIERPAEVVDLALLTAGVYWAGVVAAAVAWRFVRFPGLAALLTGAERLVTSSLLPAAVVLCSLAIVVATRAATPLVLVTPLSVLGSMWIVPATIAWVRALEGTRTSPLLLAAVLGPGVLRVIVSPYREHVLLLLLIPLVAAAFARRRVRLALVLPAALTLALGSTVVIGTYRQIVWSGASASEAISRVSLSYWMEQPYTAPWTENMRRFHVFDSLMLTVDLVPDVFPFAERNVLAEGLTRGFVPRLFDPNKEKGDEGLRFQTMIWTYDTNPEAEDATAAIAPSMPGSLYESGGLLLVAVGALCWGALLASVDRLKGYLSPQLAAGLHALCAIQALAGLERDYALAFSTLLQNLTVFAVCALIAARVTAAAPPPVPVVPALTTR